MAEDHLSFGPSQGCVCTFFTTPRSVRRKERRHSAWEDSWLSSQTQYVCMLQYVVHARRQGTSGRAVSNGGRRWHSERRPGHLLWDAGLGSAGPSASLSQRLEYRLLPYLYPLANPLSWPGWRPHRRALRGLKTELATHETQAKRPLNPRRKTDRA